MTGRAFGWWLIASVGLHVAGVAAASSVGASTHASPPPAVAIELVQIPAPQPPPRLKPAAPRAVAAAPRPRVVDPTPTMTPDLLDSPAPPRATAPGLDGALVPPAMPSAPGLAVGAPAGVGRLFAGGDLLVAPGPGDSGGRGAAGPRAHGMAASGAPSSQAVATATGLTAPARPLGGGYQIRPEYPATAIRDHAQGVTLLSVEVLSTGRVGQVIVKRSSGHRDLDRAAIDAVKQWQFEPARRGRTPVTVWATLPVNFELTDR